MRTIGLVLAVAALARAAGADEGYVDVPLPAWRQLVDARGAPPPPEPPAPIVTLERSLSGGFKKGLLSATLVARFEVLAADGHVRVPILDAAAAPGGVRLDGKPTSLVEEDGMYTVGVDRPGVYQVEATFRHGQEQDRFSRQLKLALPPGGPTRLALLVPETDVEAHLEHGSLTQVSARDGGTLLEGYLDASGVIDFSWSRRVGHAGPASHADLTARVRALLTVGETLTEGSAVYDVAVVEGETDRLELRVPAGVEVTDVAGDAVLQWHTDGDRLTVLFRYLVDRKTSVTVRFQAATEPGAPVPLRLPLPAGGVPASGQVGVRAPAGLDVKVASVADATPLGLRELPAALTDMSGTPILFGFAFAAPPSIVLAVTRLEQVELTSTLIDDIEASTVLLDDGTEITKLRLYIRNNTRQYLRVRPPAGAVLTHALVDGHPVRPARSPDVDGLLFSLRQSERIDPGVGRTHIARRGDTLRDIAHLYYSDPDKWQVILDANQKLMTDATDLAPGMRLVIPAQGAVTVEESSFVLELAYRRAGPALGRVGLARLELPELDIDALAVNWDVYAPDAVVPLAIAANLTQIAPLRYGTFRRFEIFLEEALGEAKAWAGGDGYSSILSKRKAIYHEEAALRGGADVAPAAFPLVGQRYRFKRLLADRERPRVALLYATRPVVAALRWAGLVAAFALATLLLRPGRRWWAFVVAALAGAALLILAHHVPGVHRRLVWGVDLALIVTLIRVRRARGPLGLRELLAAPWRLLPYVDASTLLVAGGLLICATLAVRFPLLLSLVALVVLARVHQRFGANPGGEP
jgi:hypothetical protein